jgi:hypothetical protein
MKANELMIGDWVIYNPNVFVDDEYESIKDYYPIQISNGEDIDLAIEGCYQPIPLTPEVLEKNGFVVESKYCHGEPLQYCELVDGLWIDISGENFFEGKLEYVHQLQHTLSLCGIEKTIEL